MNIPFLAAEAILLAATLSLDAFVASFAYGSSGIKIPPASVVALNLVCSGTLGISLWMGAMVRPFLSPRCSGLICFGVLFVMGLVKLLDNAARSFLRRYGEGGKSIQFSLFSLRMVLCIYADPKQADADCSNSISVKEAISLAVALSLDGMAVGFGAALGSVHSGALLLASPAAGTGAVLLGERLGNRLAARIKCNISWLSGLVLIGLAFLKLT